MQLKLISAYYNLEHAGTLQGRNNLFHTSSSEELQGKRLLKPDFILALMNRLKTVFSSWLKGKTSLLQSVFIMKACTFICNAV